MDPHRELEPVYGDRTAPVRAAALRSRFAAVSRSAVRRPRPRFASILMMAGAATAFITYLAVGTVAFGNPLAAIKHLAAAPDCRLAARLGVARAWQGEPGYWSWHDRDGNRLACERIVSGG